MDEVDLQEHLQKHERDDKKLLELNEKANEILPENEIFRLLKKTIKTQDTEEANAERRIQTIQMTKSGMLFLLHDSRAVFGLNIFYSGIK